MEIEQGHVLVVNNNETKSNIFVRHLEELGYRATIAKDGRQIVELLAADNLDEARKKMFALVLLEIARASEMDTYQVLEQLKADSNLRYIPVIVTSTADGADMVARCIELGAEDYLLEPVNPVLLKTRIDASVMKASLDKQAQPSSGLSLKLERDLEIGHQIQIDFLPDKDEVPRISGWDIAARLHPARQVAGDFYDAFSLGRNKIGLFIGDVCDKGVGPAMFMALTRSLLRAFAEQHRPLSWMDSLSNSQSVTDSEKKVKAKRQKILLSSGTSALLAVELTNNYIGENHGAMNMFATLFFGVLDPGTGVFTYINGGHDAPAIVGADGMIKTRLKPTGPVVGIFPNANYEIDQVTLEPGDLLMTFTDGVPDARNPDGKRFTVDGLFPLLKEPFSSVDGLLDRIEAGLFAYIADADQYDDITMLAVRRELA